MPSCTGEPGSLKESVERDKQIAFFLSQKSPYAVEEKGHESSTNSKNMIPNGWTQEQYDMYIQNGYEIDEYGRIYKDGIMLK